MIDLVGTYWVHPNNEEQWCKVMRQTEFNVWCKVHYKGVIHPSDLRMRTWMLFKFWKHMPKLAGMVKLGE